ncbi:MAG: LysM peptidoglycan-binding domain-containing protein [Mucilaginibacter sp.]
MKFKLLLLTLSFITCSLSLYAKSTADSVGVENQNGKKVILHKLDPKDNYYSIGRRYNVAPKLIIAFNNNAKMTIGTIIKVPTDRPFVEQTHIVQKPAPVAPPTNQPNANTGKDGTATQYKVSVGETLYAISKRFGTTVEDIMNLNGLKSNDIHPGEILLVKANSSGQPIPPVHAADTIVAKRDSTTMVATQDSSNAEHRFNTNKYGLYEKDEKGVATWMDDDGLDPNRKLVLHRTAPIGTVIKITNIMTNRTTFAKVVGRFTDNEQTKDVIIVMTKGVAESLGALDKRFQVTLSYGSPNE